MLWSKQNNAWQLLSYASRLIKKTNKDTALINGIISSPVVYQTFQLLSIRVSLYTPNGRPSTAFGTTIDRGNKTYQSRLTRWVNRLLPFHFKVEHITGKNLLFVDFLIRHAKSPPTGENIDKDLVLNTVVAFHYKLHTANRKLTNQWARKLSTHYDVKFQCKRNEQKNKAPSAIHTLLNSPTHIDLTIFKENNYFQQQIIVIIPTRMLLYIN